MSTTQKISLAAGLVVFLALGITATAVGSASLSQDWLKAGLAGVIVYALTAFGIGVAQGAAQAKQDRESPQDRRAP